LNFDSTILVLAHQLDQRRPETRNRETEHEGPRRDKEARTIEIRCRVFPKIDQSVSVTRANYDSPQAKVEHSSILLSILQSDWDWCPWLRILTAAPDETESIPETFWWDSPSLTSRAVPLSFSSKNPSSCNYRCREIYYIRKESLYRTLRR